MDDQKVELDELRAKVRDRWLTLRQAFNLETRLEQNIEKWRKFVKPTLALAVVIGAGDFLTTGGSVLTGAFAGGLLAASLSARLAVALDQMTLGEVEDALQVQQVGVDEYYLAKAQWEKETFPQVGNAPQPR